MSDIDKSNIDAMYWAEKFCEIMRETDFEIDEGLMVSWFANYRFAVADPMTAEIERLKSHCRFLLSFAPTDNAPKGLNAAAYHTLTHEGDSKLFDRIIEIKNEVES